MSERRIFTAGERVKAAELQAAFADTHDRISRIERTYQLGGGDGGLPDGYDDLPARVALAEQAAASAAAQVAAAQAQALAANNQAQAATGNANTASAAAASAAAAAAAATARAEALTAELDALQQQVADLTANVPIPTSAPAYTGNPFISEGAAGPPSYSGNPTITES